MYLTTTASTYELVTSAAISTDVSAAFVDHTTTGATPDSSAATVSTATTTTVVAAPAASTQRQVTCLSVRNKGASANTIKLQKKVSGTAYEVWSVTLQAGESLLWTSAGLTVYDVSGNAKVDSALTTATTGVPSSVFKAGTTTEAAGVWHSHYAASGAPGSWAPGTPGVNGRATDGTTSSDAGCMVIANATSGANYLVGAMASATVAQTVGYFDYLWVNSGLNVTTLTAQAISAAALPARDAAGTVNGSDCWFGILVTTATTNVGAITTITATYTDPGGTTGRTALISSFPATAVQGTFVPFQQTGGGQRGCKAIESITLGTSMVTGAISLVVYRQLAFCTVPSANIAGNAPLNPQAGIRLYDGICVIPMSIPSATTASTISGMLYVSQR